MHTDRIQASRRRRLRLVFDDTVILMSLASDVTLGEIAEMAANLSIVHASPLSIAVTVETTRPTSAA